MTTLPEEIDSLLVAKTLAVAHEVNKQVCEFFGDDSQVPFAEAPDWQVRSTLDGIQAMASGAVKTPEDAHENWMKHKIEDGWVYGEVKDPDAKTHPCLVPYNELPREQQLKDHLFQAVVKTMLL